MEVSLISKRAFQDAPLKILIGNQKNRWKLAQVPEKVEAFFKSKPDSPFEMFHFEEESFWLLNFQAKDSRLGAEGARRLGNQLRLHLDKRKIDSAAVLNISSSKNLEQDLLEGLLLGDYHFDKYFTQNKKEETKTSLGFYPQTLSKKAFEKLQNLVDANHTARNLVNEPLSYLTAEQYAKDMKTLGKEAGLEVEVFNKKKIQSLKMGGLLAVNLGSPLPPTFTKLEWKPSRPKNKQPWILIGKGVVYDTGGLSLKPTPNSMDIMKCDMGGSAAVFGALLAIAKNKLPIHLIGLIPATDNRPGGNAYVPGDVIEMHNKMTVEVLNTDAEGRMLLADALSYAQQFNPELVIDLATLTGSAARALGKEAAVSMGTAADKHFRNLEKAGENCFERVVRFPFYDDYADYLKSQIADIKNIGGPSAGAITAGKFLQNFTNYPWIHIDIAGPTWLQANEHYKSRGASGYGVRLLYHFLKSSFKL